MASSTKKVVKKYTEYTANPNPESVVFPGVELGKAGTIILSGYISEDYSDVWRNTQSKCRLIKQMVYSDSTISAILNAWKDPIRSAKWFIEPASDSPEDIMIADFISDMLFGDLIGGFDNFIYELLSMFEYGFSLFEKIYKRRKDGLIIIERYAPRLQESILRWTIDGMPWVDGHPAGVTQIIYGTDEATLDKNLNPSIPWNKLTKFTYHGTGHNYEGISVLRHVHQNWYYKDLFYKLAGMGQEKWSMGIPMASYDNSITPDQKAALEITLQNVRSNQQAYILKPKTVDVEILMPPSNSGKSNALDSLIAHHDKKIYDSILAGFLNLSSGDGGSNALSKDQSSFFLRSLNASIALIQNVLNEDIKEICYLNFNGLTRYPKVKTSDVGDMNLYEYIQSIALAINANLLGPLSEGDQAKVREVLKLTSQVRADSADMDTGEEQLAPVKPNQETNDGTGSPKPSAGSKGGSGNSNSQEKSPTRTDFPVKDEFPLPAFAESSITLSDDSVTESKQEYAYMRDIQNYENFLQSEYARIEGIVSEKERELQSTLKDIINKSDTERVDGVLKIAKTSTNRQRRAQALDAVRTKTKQISRIIFKNANNKQTQFMKNLFRTTRRMAIESLKKHENFFSESFTDSIDEGKFRGYINGYMSNVEALLDNEDRKMEESIDQNYSSGVSTDLAASQVDTFGFNRNILKLSIITHPRAAYNAMQYDMNVDRSFNMFKVLAPKSVIKKLEPNGMTAKLLYNIYTVAQLNKLVHELTDQKNADVVNGLGFHHNAIAYFFPIPSDQLDIEEQVSRAQRSQFKKMINQ